MANYTYVTFAQDVLAMVNGEIDGINLDNVAAKANALIARETNKSDYNKTHEKKSAPKGPSEATLAGAALIKTALYDRPLTADEINVALSTNYTPLQISTFAKYAEGVSKTTKVIIVTNKDGLKSEKERVAYMLTA